MSTQGLKVTWFNRLAAAELNLRLAQDRLHDAITGLKPDNPNVADGLLVFRQASKAEVEALREYERVLRTLVDLVGHGKFPDDSDEEQ